MPDTKKKYTENTDKVINEDFNPTANVDAVGGFNYDAWNDGGSGVGSKSNIEKLASDYVNSNYDSFTQGDDYASLAKRYGQQGQQAMKDTLGQVSARTGGLASSYATQVAQQSYNGYMEKLEDAARSLYDSQMAEKANKLGVAQGLYDSAYNEWQDGRNFAYGKWQQDVSNAQWKDSQEMRVDEIEYQRSKDARADAEDNLYADIYYGGEDNFDAYGGILDRASYDRIVKSAQEARADKDAGYAKEDQMSASKDIQARIANGESLENIASDYEIGNVSTADSEGGGTTWESLTGKSEAEWKQIYNDNEVKGYKYSNDAEGAANIANALVNSAGMTLSAKDQKNFDYIYGDGAYNAVQDFAKYMSPNDPSIGFEVYQDMNPALFEEHYNYLVDGLVAAVPGLPYEQILEFVEKVNPNAYKAATDDTWLKFSSYEQWKNTPGG